MKYFSLKRLQDEDPTLYSKLRQRCYKVNGCCMAVHDEMGPFLNEYMYQDALAIIFQEKQIPFQKEYYFTVDFHGQQISHRHYADFLCDNGILLECKAIETLGNDQRQQLWNYMRLTKTPLGILWNFAPVNDQSEHYFLDTATNQMYMF